MKFRLIPPGEFLMGSTPAEIEEALKFTPGEDKHWQDCIKSEAPQHKVILTRPIYLGVHEVTQGEYEKVMGTNPSHFAAKGEGNEAVAGMETVSHPVEQVSWNDAAEFCAKLSEQEKLKPFYFRSGETVTSLDGTGYRLPTEAVWEFACRAGTTTKYWIGDKDEDLVKAGWFGSSSAGRTHRVRELKANPLGLYDIHGNVWEWVQDSWEPTYYEQFQERPALDPNGPSFAGSARVLRGGWHFNASSCRSSHRLAFDPPGRGNHLGFRVTLSVDTVIAEIARDKTKSASNSREWHGWPADAPTPAIAPFDANQAKKHQEEWAVYLKVPVEYTNSIGMKFRLIPPGEFAMGIANRAVADAGTLSSEQWSQKLRRSQPEHRVVISRPFYFSIHETTQSQFISIMGRNPFHFCKSGKGTKLIKELDTDQYPAEMISFQDAVEFANQLSTTGALPNAYKVEGTSVSRTNERGYRLPTEAEWEYAVRAGNTMNWYFGDDKSRLKDVAWIAENSAGTTHPVGQLAANPFGLHDVYGNVCEWCEDWFDENGYRAPTEALDVDPRGPASGETRVIRGSGWFGDPIWSFSGWRDGIRPDYRYNDNGVRLVLSVDDVRQLIKLWTQPASENGHGRFRIRARASAV